MATKTATLTHDPVTGKAYADMQLFELASVVRRDWTRPYFGAVPYLEALYSLRTVADRYYFDTGESVVRYFLANAGTWRGDVARAVKAELKRRIPS